jgi:hypothetical protein
MTPRKREPTNNESASIQHAIYSMSVVTGLVIVSSIMSVLAITTVNSVYGQEEDLSTEGNTSATSASDLTNNSQVKFRSNIEQIIGHLDAAMLNKESGDDTLALAHAFHPVAEVYSLIEPYIVDTNSSLNQTLGSALDHLTAIAKNSTAQEFSMGVEQANELLNKTIDIAIPLQLRDNLTFNRMVMTDLLNTAENEYEEAVANNTIKEMVEYQDAQAFISRAENLSTQISDTMLESTQEINEIFSELNNKIMNISSFESVQATIQQLVHEISEAAGIRDTVGQTSSDQLISSIRDLLNQTITEYGNQNYSEAESLATKAYLENYEYIEAPLAQKNQTLMEGTEVMLREELRRLIQDRVPSQEIQAQIEKINANLDKAEELLIDSN